MGIQTTGSSNTMSSSGSNGKPKLRKGLWSPEEDEKLVRYITKFGHKCWSIVPKQAGLQRCGKSCRLRWINYLRPDLKRGQFTQDEESVIVKLHSMLGNRWAQIATQLPGRTDNEIKNFWNSCLRKKLRQYGIDPNTHKPLMDLMPVKLGAQFSAGESLDSNAQEIPTVIQRMWDDRSTSHSQSDIKSTNFALSMLPITFNPHSRALIMPHSSSQVDLGELNVKGNFSFKVEEHEAFESLNLSQTSPTSEEFSRECSSSSESHNLGFPFTGWEPCSSSSSSGGENLMRCSSESSWEFTEAMFSPQFESSAPAAAAASWNHRSLPDFYEDDVFVS